jgi:hypothetical protein
VVSTDSVAVEASADAFVWSETSQEAEAVPKSITPSHPAKVFTTVDAKPGAHAARIRKRRRITTSSIDVNGEYIPENPAKATESLAGLWRLGAFLHRIALER